MSMGVKGARICVLAKGAPGGGGGGGGNRGGAGARTMGMWWASWGWALWAVPPGLSGDG